MIRLVECPDLIRELAEPTVRAETPCSWSSDVQPDISSRAGIPFRQFCSGPSHLFGPQNLQNLQSTEENQRLPEAGSLITEATANYRPANS